MDCIKKCEKFTSKEIPSMIALASAHGDVRIAKPLGLKTVQKPYVVWSLDTTALESEPLEP